MLEVARRGGLALGFQVMQVIKYLFLVQLQRTTVKMKSHGGQTAAIIGQRTLAFAR